MNIIYYLVNIYMLMTNFLGTPELPSHYEGSGTGMQLPDGTDLRQVTVLSKGDWERIQQQLYRKQIEEERLQKMVREREERKAKSKETVQHWGNTIAVSSMKFSKFLDIQI